MKPLFATTLLPLCWPPTTVKMMLFSLEFMWHVCDGECRIEDDGWMMIEEVVCLMCCDVQ